MPVLTHPIGNVLLGELEEVARRAATTGDVIRVVRARWHETIQGTPGAGDHVATPRRGLAVVGVPFQYPYWIEEDEIEAALSEAVAQAERT